MALERGVRRAHAREPTVLIFENVNAEDRKEDMQSEEYNASEVETSDDENESNLPCVESDSEETVNDDTEWIDDVIEHDSESAPTTSSDAEDDDEDPMHSDDPQDSL